MIRSPPLLEDVWHIRGTDDALVDGLDQNVVGHRVVEFEATVGEEAFVLKLIISHQLFDHRFDLLIKAKVDFARVTFSELAFTAEDAVAAHHHLATSDATSRIRFVMGIANTDDQLEVLVHVVFFRDVDATEITFIVVAGRMRTTDDLEAAADDGFREHFKKFVVSDWLPRFRSVWQLNSGQLSVCKGARSVGFHNGI